MKLLPNLLPKKVHFTIHGSDNNQETARQIIERERPVVKKTIEMIEKTTYEKKTTILETLISKREKVKEIFIQNRTDLQRD